MTQMPTQREQIEQAHGQLIVAIVNAALNREVSPDLEHALQVSEQNGWTNLVCALRKILSGERSLERLQPLDEEDRVIVEAILGGIQGTRPLPDPTQTGDATVAAAGLAGMIHEAARGRVEALRIVANMAEHMTVVGGDMGRLGGLLKRLVDGERDADRLSESLGPQGESLLLAVLEELGKLERH